MSDNEEIWFVSHSKSYCVCIIDIVNSTQVIAKMTNSKDIRKYYSIFINSSTSIARNFDARLIKNVGDSLIYYFPNTDDTSNVAAFTNALSCCLSLCAADSVITKRLAEECLPSIQYRVSADYGKVEIAKTRTSQDYDLFGSTVNLCAKINKLSAPDTVLIGGDLFRVLKSLLPAISSGYNIRPAGEYSIGIMNSYPLYAVTAAKSYKPVIQSLSPDLKSVQKTAMDHVTEDLKQHTRHSGRIMLVDDDKDILYTFRTILTSQGLQVDSYYDPHEALSVFTQTSNNYYDLVILDIRMPRLNGLELYSKIKLIDRDIKVLFVSALDASEELLSIIPGVEAENILRKPLEINYFVSAVKRNLSLFS